MEDEVASEAQALFDYDRQHFDEVCVTKILN